MARSELVWSQPRESGVGGRTAFGMYASGDYQFARRWYAGARYDHSGRASDASTVDTGGAFYLTYWPSEFNQVRVSVLGMYFSVRFDLPTGATIVCTFGLVLVIMALCKPIVARRAARLRARSAGRGADCYSGRRSAAGVADL